jgi:hypothetical protein
MCQLLSKRSDPVPREPHLSLACCYWTYHVADQVNAPSALILSWFLVREQFPQFHGGGHFAILSGGRRR